jgi:hypothetical protein
VDVRVATNEYVCDCLLTSFHSWIL